MEVRITENSYGKCDAKSQLVYPGVDSCLTITALFGDGSRTGAHLTQTGDWKSVLDTWKNKTKEKQAKEKHKGILTVFVLGDQGWPEKDKTTIWQGIGELGEDFGESATDATLKVESRYGDISIDDTGHITGRQHR